MNGRFLLVALVGGLLIYVGGKFGEPMGTYFVLTGIVLVGAGMIFGLGGTERFMTGVTNSIMAIAALFFAWLIWIGAEHMAWVPKVFVDLPGPHRYGDGDFIRPLFLAAVLGLGVFALIGFLLKRGGDHSEHT